MAALPHDLAERLLDGSPDAILICAPAGTVHYWNAAAERIFGFPATEAIGVSMNLIIPERVSRPSLGRLGGDDENGHHPLWGRPAAGRAGAP